MADALSTPLGASTLVDAAQWVQGALLGTLATAVAVIAVAFIGFGMLSGRIDMRRALVVILGCFVVFGAPFVAAGLRRMGDSDPALIAVAPPPAAPTLPPPAPSPQPYDPYAGASVPVR
ncbi:TrbC/VirB2 family protein [Sphingomonas sp.]|uniref:TrbC/VirB2 family protein n=1 Tax=Sphingomonas sp. TaxID=28214 RepID=UPI003F7000B7